MDWSGDIDWPSDPRGPRPGYTPGARELEIWHWLSENDPNQCDWRVLDDMAWLFSKDCIELVEVEGTTGITADTLAELDGWLRTIGGAR
jgi:HAD domain in Swiss Army Knife RNA repair proteins